jgi:hypothetical protein
MAKITRKKIKKKTSPPTPKTKVEEVIEEEIIEEVLPEPDWKESTGNGAKNKFCKPCLKKNSCVIGALAMVITCDRIIIKKKRVKD